MSLPSIDISHWITSPSWLFSKNSVFFEGIARFLSTEKNTSELKNGVVVSFLHKLNTCLPVATKKSPIVLNLREVMGR